MKELKVKELNIDVKEFDEEAGTLRAVISSGMPDRQGEMIDQSSWKLDEFKSNPVVLWAHDHSQPAIGQAIDIGLNSDGMLEAVIKFAVKEYAFAKTIFKLYAGKFMRQFSVGFLNEEVDEVNDIKVLRNNTLYEFSAVNVGADALALAKSKGFDISPFEKTYKPGTWIPDTESAPVPAKEKMKRSPSCRMKGESKNECVSRKKAEIKKEKPKLKESQALAMAINICNISCDEKCLEKEGRVLSAKNRTIIEKAKSALDDVLRADKNKDNQQRKTTVKLGYKKILNKVVRELLEAKK